MRPLPDETAGSILFRLAQSRCQPTSVLCEELFGLSHAQARSDLDLRIPIDHGAALAKLLNLGTRQFERLLLPSKFVTSVRNRVSQQHDGPIRLCHRCMAEAKYGRRFWRTCFAAACPDHGLELTESCPHCGTRIPHFGWTGEITLQLWLESWPTCPACLRCVDTAPRAHPVLVAMSKRWRSALAGYPQYRFEAAGFLRLSANLVRCFRTIDCYQEAASAIAPNSYWAGHLAAALLIRSICRNRTPSSACYAALGMPFQPAQLAKDIVV